MPRSHDRGDLRSVKIAQALGDVKRASWTSLSTVIRKGLRPEGSRVGNTRIRVPRSLRAKLVRDDGRLRLWGSALLPPLHSFSSLQASLDTSHRPYKLICPRRRR